jgi:hypothetical protein
MQRPYIVVELSTHAPSQFQQIYTIHARIDDQMYPLLFDGDRQVWNNFNTGGPHTTNHIWGLAQQSEVANVMMRLLSPSSNSRNSSPVVVWVHGHSSMMCCCIFGSLGVTLRLALHSDEFTEGNVESVNIHMYRYISQVQVTLCKTTKVHRTYHLMGICIEWKTTMVHVIDDIAWMLWC